MRYSKAVVRGSSPLEGKPRRRLASVSPESRVRVRGIGAGGEPPVESEAPRGGAGSEDVVADPAIAGPELEGVIADELRGGAVHLMGGVEDVVRIPRAVSGQTSSAVIRDPDLGEDLARDLGKVVRRETELSWIVGGIARLVREREIPVAKVRRRYRRSRPRCRSRRGS